MKISKEMVCLKN